MSTAADRRAGVRTAGLAAVLLACGVLAGCVSTVSEAVTFRDPVALEAVPGSDTARLTLTLDAAKRLGLETAATGGDAAGIRVPYSALLYKADGTTWVYTSTADLVYRRFPVTVDRVDGDSVLLTAGPQPGTPVVVTGAQELFGAEFDTAH